ncbi:hypothetical protein [Phytohabitans houttuyneae]|nr:hypothetical protein [Phytohabitans houttuyneae]
MTAVATESGTRLIRTSERHAKVREAASALAVPRRGGWSKSAVRTSSTAGSAGLTAAVTPALRPIRPGTRPR